MVLLAAACFTAIAHLLRTWLGVVGSAITLVLLMVQLTSAGGLYPVETLPAPFRAIHAFIPMTYLFDALRITLTGGPTDHLWRAVLVLAGFTVVAVGACVCVAHRAAHVPAARPAPVAGVAMSGAQPNRSIERAHGSAVPRRWQRGSRGRPAPEVGSTIRRPAARLRAPGSGRPRTVHR